MTSADIKFVLELPSHAAAIEEINAEAFGPGRYTRAAYRIREAGPHDPSLSFVAIRLGDVIASVRMTPVVAGVGRAHLLGPLAVRPAFKNQGIGRHLVALALDAARDAGSPAVILVGDAPYYGPLGFQRLAWGQIELPGPVDPARLLVAPLLADGASELRGPLKHAGAGALVSPMAHEVQRTAKRAGAR